MKDRLVTGAGALLIVLVLFALVVDPAGREQVARPLSEEAGGGGYLALRQWLESGGVAVVSHRRRYSALLDAAAAPSSGNILVTTMPHAFRVRVNEVEPLLEWVRNGNTLLVLAALDDSPKWAVSSGFDYFMNDLRALTGLHFAVSEAGLPDEEDEDAPLDPIAANGALELIANPDHPLMRDVDRLQTTSFLPSSVWEAVPADDRLLVGLATEAGTGETAIWQSLVGAGQVIVVGSGTLLSNASIGVADNRHWVANLIRDHLGPGAAVLFDDMHQGRSDLYDPRAFFADPRLHHTIGFVLAWWFLWLVGSSNRLAPPATEAREPAQGDYVEAVGGFMARRLAAADAARLMIDRWVESLGFAEGRLADWRALRQVPTLDTVAVDEIAETYDKVGRGENVDLVKLHNVLLRARKDMA